jgi:hypothetical protein
LQSNKRDAALEVVLNPRPSALELLHDRRNPLQRGMPAPIGSEQSSMLLVGLFRFE